MDLSVHLDVTSLWIGAGLGILGIFVLLVVIGGISSAVKARKQKDFLKSLSNLPDIDWSPDWDDWSSETPKAKPQPEKPKPKKNI